MKAKNKRWIIISGIALICCLCCIFSAVLSEKRLTTAQIELLRERYPVCGLKVPATISVNKMNVDQVKNIVDTFVYGEVLGCESEYSVATSFSDEALNDKRAENGIDEVFEFYEYPIEVISDTEGKYASGDVITIAANTAFIDYNPVLSVGMRIVVPVVQDEKIPSRNYYTVDGMYYVTPEGYALAAFDEENVSVSRGVSSGVKVETLLKNLKK